MGQFRERLASFDLPESIDAMKETSYSDRYSKLLSALPENVEALDSVWHDTIEAELSISLRNLPLVDMSTCIPSQPPALNHSGDSQSTGMHEVGNSKVTIQPPSQTRYDCWLTCPPRAGRASSPYCCP